MDASELFFDCPAYLDARGTVRCGLPAEIAETYTLASTDGPVESARIRCPHGHHFNGPVEAFHMRAPAAGRQFSERQFSERQFSERR
jgi:hypothetical protein